MSTSAYRNAGIFLLLTALATAISVPARLAADADATPLTDILAQFQSYGEAEIAQFEATEKLAAIGSASFAYGLGGAARLVGGIALLAAAIPIWRAMRAHHPVAMTAAALFLGTSGVASAVSGAAAVALAITAPEPQASTTLTAGWASSSDVANALKSMATATAAEETVLYFRWLTGTIGFTLAGLALVALAPVQWRMGGIMRATAVIDAVLGIAMLFIWVDAATVVHRITGIAFLLWLIVAGLWLVVPRLRTIGMPTPPARVF